jgi:hypothetical protein
MILSSRMTCVPERRNVNWGALGRVLPVVGMLLWPTPLRAAGSGSVALRYDVDHSGSACPTEAAFRVMAARRLGYDPFRDSAGETVLIRAQDTERGIEGSVAWFDADGRRVGKQRFMSENRDCADLVQAMAFAFAVQVQLWAAVDSSPVVTPRARSAPRTSPAEQPKLPPPAAAPSQTAVHIEAPAEVAIVVDQKPSKRRDGFSFVVGAGSGVGVSLAPTTSIDGHVFAAMQYRFASVEVGAEATLPSSARLDDRSGFRYRSSAGSLAICGHLRWWATCGVGKIGQIHVEGYGVAQSLSPSGTQSSAGGRVAVTHRMWGHLAASVHADWLKSLAPWTVEVNHTRTWSTPAWGIQLGMEVGALFD